MATEVEKNAVNTKQESTGMGNFLRTARNGIESHAINHTKDSSSSNLMASHFGIFLAVEGVKEVLDILRGMSKRKEK